jgi:hypothetical protein
MGFVDRWKVSPTFHPAAAAGNNLKSMDEMMPPISYAPPAALHGKFQCIYVESPPISDQVSPVMP